MPRPLVRARRCRRTRRGSTNPPSIHWWKIRRHAAWHSESQCNGDSDQVDGVNQGTGTPATVANAPINKYFVSLMKALGVKARADGFPLPGGTAEVTHYGMYDGTEDFVGGQHHQPGWVRRP